MTDALIIFASTFAVVFFLGLQSLNVNNGHFAAAALTSFGISLANLYILKAIPAQTTALDLAAYMSGGPIGIVVAMWLHPRIKRWAATRAARKAASSAPPTRAPSTTAGLRSDNIYLDP